MPEKKKSGWVTLKGGTHVHLDEKGNITKGPNRLVGGNVATAGRHGKPAGIEGPCVKYTAPSKSIEQYIKEDKKSASNGALSFYQNELQGKYVDAKINGETEQVFFTRALGVGKNDLTVYVARNKNALPLIQFIPSVISSGANKGFEKPAHERGDFVGFHVFEKEVTYKNKKYKITAKVGERADGVKMFAFYYMGKTQSAAKDKSLDGTPAIRAIRTTRQTRRASIGADQLEGILGFEVLPVNDRKKDKEYWTRRLAQAFIDLARHSTKRRAA